MRQKGGRSKREKKHRVTQSLKHKHNESRLETLADDDLARRVRAARRRSHVMAAAWGL